MADGRYQQPFDVSTATVLITGASSGIGLGLAQCFVRAGATVIITGRREQQLKDAVEQLKQNATKKVYYRVNDVERAEDRQALFEWITREHPQTNILINNAGIQQRAPFVPNEETNSGNISWNEREQEIQINICAPIHLAQMFMSHFRKMNTTTAIINVSSGLGFVPLAIIPIYSATKAALHSFTMSLRFQLDDQIPSIQVYEIIPPAVQTNLGGSHAFGEPLDDYCQSTFERLIKGEQEIGYKMSDETRKFASREQFDKVFIGLNTQFKKIFEKK